MLCVLAAKVKHKGEVRSVWANCGPISLTFKHVGKRHGIPPDLALEEDHWRVAGQVGRHLPAFLQGAKEHGRQGRAPHFPQQHLQHLGCDASAL